MTYFEALQTARKLMDGVPWTHDTVVQVFKNDGEGYRVEVRDGSETLAVVTEYDPKKGLIEYVFFN